MLNHMRYAVSNTIPILSDYELSRMNIIEPQIQMLLLLTGIWFKCY